MIPLSRFLKIFFPPIIVLAVHLILTPFNIYDLFPRIDIPMHFLGGLTVSLSFYKLLKIAQDKRYLRIHNTLLFLFIISLVALTAIAWEFAEFATDKTLNLNSQLSLSNTLADLLFGLVGGASSYFITKK